MLTIQDPHSLLDTLPEPEPSLGREAYHRERELRFAFSPACRENRRRFEAENRRVADVTYTPQILDIENVSRCNFRCVMCQTVDFPRGGRARDMSLAEFKALIDSQEGLVEIKLNGIGEPLLQGDDYFAMIRYARERHIWVRIVTNASLLHREDNHRKLIDSGVNEVQISVDGATKEVFEHVRRGSRFERIVENCRLINDYCRQQQRPVTKMWTVVQRANAHQLEELVTLGANLGFGSAVFSLHVNGWGSPSTATAIRTLNVSDQLDFERLSQLVLLGSDRGLRVSFWRITQKYSTESPKHLCPWPFSRAYVSSEGRTVPCCMIANPSQAEIAPGRSFAEAWNSDEYRAFRQAHLDGNIPPPCKGCYA